VLRKKAKYTEMTIYTDLIVEEADTCLKSLGIQDKDKVYEKKPKECVHCKCKRIINIEVLGAYDDTLFWECSDCESLFCKLPKDKTEQYLKKGREYWTTRRDWVLPEKGRLN
tara:strand:- start:664 stop:999 length:336 start_codon:yes stop_codon:yes gene_type:complete